MCATNLPFPAKQVKQPQLPAVFRDKLVVLAPFDARQAAPLRGQRVEFAGQPLFLGEQRVARLLPLLRGHKLRHRVKLRRWGHLVRRCCLDPDLRTGRRSHFSVSPESEKPEGAACFKTVNRFQNAIFPRQSRNIPLNQSRTARSIMI